MEPPNDIVALYDLPSVLSPMSWSPNPWKTRMALNFKGIPHRTVWIEYPDIEPTMKRWGAAPAMPPRYTVPVISVPDPTSGRPTFFGESFEIALELDRLYPDRPLLFPAGSHALQALFRDTNFDRVNKPTWPLLVPLIAESLREGSVEYFVRTREEIFGSLEKLCPIGSKEREEEWKKFKASLDVMDGIIKRNQGGGKWIMGDQMSFADIGLGSEFIILQRLLPKEEWERVTQWHDGRWKTLLDNLAPYMAEDYVVQSHL